MRMWMTLVGVAAAALFTTSYASAQTAGRGPGHEGMRHEGRAYDSEHGSMHHQKGMMSGKDFSLTPEQKASLRELKRKFKLENGQLIGALVGKKIELNALWTDPKADPKVIAEKEKEFGALKFQIRDKAIQFRLEARKFLTPEQIAKFGARWGMGRYGRHHMMGREGMMGSGGMMHRRSMAGHEGMMGKGEMMHGGSMAGHQGMMGEGGMGCCGGKMDSEKGMGMMKHKKGGMGGMGMCQ
jgi:Spy/CpxP family protein refolding chaperone